ncbi:MAG: sulfotransferase [Pseudomonadota bacterium]|nr:sulfotransferase [Pseudomonadota bacterium]|tara:strand:+ start:276 stop:1130 length:855 start_codon:yes stop_codon:yes gene_type:complete
MKPNFLIIGAARSATTSLYKYLSHHPEVFFPTIKEINYFSNERFWQRGEAWYTNQFNSAVGKKAIGEASTSYTSAVGNNDIVPKRIKSALGSIKLIYIVRDPIDRALSHYMHYYHRSERVMPISELLNNKVYEDTLWQGKYAHQIDMYLRHFTANSLLVITVDELKSNPQKTMDRIFSHIEIDKMDIGEISKETHNANDTATEKGKFGKWVMNNYQRHIEQRELPWPLKKAFLTLAKLDSTPLEKPTLSVQQLSELQEFYALDLKRMQEEYGLDLSSWGTVIKN